MEAWKKKTILFITSQTLSMFGSAVVSFSIVWHITLETSSGVMMTIATLCVFIPQICVSLPAGVLADRYSRKKLIILGDACVAVTTLALALLYIGGHTDLWLVFLALALRSLFSGIQAPAVGAIIPQIVPEQHLQRVNALNTTINSVSTLISPVVGGAVLAGLGFGWSLMVDTVTAISAIFILSLMTVARLPQAEEPARPLADLMEGLRYSWSNQFLRYLLIYYAVTFFLVSPASFLTPLLVERTFGPEVWRLSANEMSWSVGSVIGGVAVSLWGGFKNRVFSLGVSMLSWGVTFALLGLVQHFWAYLAVMLISGMFLPLFSSAEMTLVQEKVEPAMMGRVFSMIQLIVSIIMPVGMLCFGPLADVVSVQTILIASGGLMAVLALPIFSRKMLSFDEKAGLSRGKRGQYGQPAEATEP